MRGFAGAILRNREYATYLNGMYEEGLNPDEVLNQVGDPEAFIGELRDAYRDRQLRRRQFIDSLSDEVKAEWIDGEAVYHSPAREAHNWTSTGIITLLSDYSRYVESVSVRVEKAMVEAGENNFEPDICLFRQPDGSLPRDMVVYPRPDLAVEILSKRTAERDLGTKKLEYARAGTTEYWVVDADAQTVRQFGNDGDGRFVERRRLGLGDTLESVLLPGLRFPLEAIWEPAVSARWTARLVVGAAEREGWDLDAL